MSSSHRAGDIIAFFEDKTRGQLERPRTALVVPDPTTPRTTEGGNDMGSQQHGARHRGEVGRSGSQGQSQHRHGRPCRRRGHARRSCAALARTELAFPTRSVPRKGHRHGAVMHGVHGAKGAAGGAVRERHISPVPTGTPKDIGAARAAHTPAGKGWEKSEGPKEGGRWDRGRRRRREKGWKTHGNDEWLRHRSLMGKPGKPGPAGKVWAHAGKVGVSPTQKV
jgi:hypothetical protein